MASSHPQEEANGGRRAQSCASRPPGASLLASPWLLRFRQIDHETAFQDEQVLALRKADVVGAVFFFILSTIFMVRESRNMGAGERLAMSICLSLHVPLTVVLLRRPPTATKRTRFKLAVHAANIAFMSHFGQKSALDTLSLSAARFAFKVAFDSKAVAVAMGVLGRPLPWFCHIVVAAAQLAAVAGTNVSCCTQLSAEADDLLRVRMTSLMRGLNYVAQPAFWITGSPLDTLLLPHTPASRCWLVYTFVTVVVGVVMPSVALYCMELAARRRFASARGMRLKLISINPSALHAMPAAPLSSATLLFLGVEALSGVWIVLVGTAHLVGRTAWL